MVEENLSKGVDSDNMEDAIIEFLDSKKFCKPTEDTD